MLDRQIWYVAWVPWDDRVSLIPWEFLEFFQGTKETEFVGQTNLVCGMRSVG